MIQRLATLDYEAAFGGQQLVMITLTYPGDWQEVAPGPDACRRHLRALRWRWERRYGPLVAVWKREFQRRGAPHYHLGTTLPDDPEFATWLSATWADVVAHPDPEQRRRHALAGTGIDVDRSKSTDPARFARYFGKHGIWAAKDYQNQPPTDWDPAEGVGRFWGYWHLRPAVATVEIAPDVARAVVRAARRHHAASRPRTKVYRWRRVTTIDQETGEIGWKWRRRRTTVPVRRLTRAAGFLASNQALPLAESLARVAVAATRPTRTSRPSGAGPVGFLP